jgi:hypothetical protein
VRYKRKKGNKMTSQNAEGAKREYFTSGVKVRVLIDNMDNDEHGLERKIPAGTIGTITLVEYSTVTGFHYHVEFENGGWLIYYTEELASHLELL